jgi:hypothetical protein
MNESLSSKLTAEGHTVDDIIGVIVSRNFGGKYMMKSVSETEEEKPQFRAIYVQRTINKTKNLYILYTLLLG